ncbi:MAG: glycosyltransferase [Nocardioides sp.]
MLIQYGQSAAPAVAEGRAFLAPAELREQLADADVVITHGGPGTISDARRSGHRPIVVPRDPALGEHVDDHQQRFSAWCAERDIVDRARTLPDLEALLDARADTRTPAARGPDRARRRGLRRAGGPPRGLAPRRSGGGATGALGPRGQFSGRRRGERPCGSGGRRAAGPAAHRRDRVCSCGRTRSTAPSGRVSSACWRPR